MADSFGGLALPTTTPGADDAAGDPLLTYVLGFCKAVLNADLAHAFAAAHPVATFPHVVESTFAHDPEEVAFNDRTLPALFAWRIGGQGENDLTVETVEEISTLRMLWVWPSQAQRDAQRQRDPIFRAVAQALVRAIHNARHPAWVVAGDPDSTAATRGSVLPRWAGYSRMVLARTTKAAIPVLLETADAARRRPFLAVQMDWTVQEWLERDATAYGDALAGLDLTETTPDGLVTTEHALFT